MVITNLHRKRRVVLIGGEKGGTGKSTIATNLAIMSQLDGYEVLLIDTDKQSSSYKSLNRRRDKNIVPVPLSTQLTGKYIHEEIKQFAEKYEVIVIDAGGRDSVELRSAMSCSSVEVMISPVKPSEFDLDTLETMDELVYLSKAYNPNLEASILFNQTPTHSKITVTHEAREYCKDFENINICDLEISNRVSFQYAASNAQCVVEFELEQIKSMPPYQAKRYKPKASLEICCLYEKVFGYEFKNDVLAEYKNLLREAVA